MDTLPVFVKEVAMGVYVCLYCDVFTEHPEQHVHEKRTELS